MPLGILERPGRLRLIVWARCRGCVRTGSHRFGACLYRPTLSTCLTPYATRAGMSRTYVMMCTMATPFSFLPSRRRLCRIEVYSYSSTSPAPKSRRCRHNRITPRESRSMPAPPEHLKDVRMAWPVAPHQQRRYILAGDLRLHHLPGNDPYHAPQPCLILGQTASQMAQTKDRPGVSRICWTNAPGLEWTRSPALR